MRNCCFDSFQKQRFLFGGQLYHGTSTVRRYTNLVSLTIPDTWNLTSETPSVHLTWMGRFAYVFCFVLFYCQLETLRNNLWDYCCNGPKEEEGEEENVKRA